MFYGIIRRSNLEKAMAPHSRTLAWKIPWMEEPGRLQSMGSQRVRHDWTTSLSLFTFMHWRRNWQPTPCSCLENPRDRGAWWAAIYRVIQSRTWLKRLSSSSSSTSKEVQPVHPKGDQSWVFTGRTDAKTETPILWPPHVNSCLIWKEPDAGRNWGQEEKGMTEDEMAGWHHWLDGHEFEWTLGVGDGQGGLACCDSWGRKESDTTERLNWTELNWTEAILLESILFSLKEGKTPFFLFCIKRHLKQVLFFNMFSSYYFSFSLWLFALAALGLCCWPGLFLVAKSGG